MFVQYKAIYNLCTVFELYILENIVYEPGTINLPIKILYLFDFTPLRVKRPLESFYYMPDSTLGVYINSIVYGHLEHFFILTK